MSTLALPDLGAAAPGVCRDLGHSAEPVTCVDRALACVCAAAPAPPTLLDQPLLGPILCGCPPAVPWNADVESDRAIWARPVPGTPAQRIGPSRRVDAPEVAACPLPRDDVPIPRATASEDCPPVPAPWRVRRAPPECPPEPPDARAAREDPTCRVGTARLRALAGDLPARSGQRSSRPLPSAATSTGTAAAMVPAAEKPAGPAADVTRRLGIDVRLALARTPRLGPPAPSGLLDRALVGGRVARSAPRPGEGRADHRLVASVSRPASGPRAEHDSRDPRGASGPRTALVEPTRRRLSRREQPDGDGHDGGHPRDRRHTGTERAHQRPYSEPRGSGDRRAATVGAAEPMESGPNERPGSPLLRDDREAPVGREHGVRRDPLNAPDRRRTGPDRWGEGWPQAQPDDAAIEAAMQRVLTDAARRYGIEV